VKTAYESTETAHPTRIAVIIPCYRVTRSIEQVVADIGDWAWAIYCVNDACPEGSGAVLDALAERDDRVRVVHCAENGGVGAATMRGYQAAIEDGASILVKVDGDGQMDPSLVPQLVAPIVRGDADYVKGNRFFLVQSVTAMPFVRIGGNAGLSFMSKLSSGYWDLFDPTNGFTALEARVAAQLDFSTIHRRWFFESDLLFRLGLLRARIIELPIQAVYADESSNLSEVQALLTFPGLHLRNLIKRVFYNYFLRNFSIATVNLLMGLALLTAGTTFGTWHWVQSLITGNASTSGTVMLAALPVIVGLQLVLQALSYDIGAVPTRPIHAGLRE
jgi:glycosyltransferase involved in cell wall biosynthesis